jgi:UDP-N-acetylmuramate--alanine ligase
MREELVAAFADTIRPTDTLYLLPIYYAGGTADKSISSKDLVADLGDCAGTVVAPDDRGDVVADIARKANSGDMVLSMGARDPSLPAFAEQIAEGIDER